MKKNLLYQSLFISGLLILSSCKKEEETLPELDKNKQIILPRVQPIPSTTTYSQPVNPQNVTQPVQTVSPNQVVTSQPTTITKPGMNPPHGQPGHRCDISVGAPLNSKPNPKVASNNSGQSNFTKTTITPNQATPTPTPAGTATATPAILNPNTATTTTGTNPPHGQPGHVCGTPVTPTQN